MRVVTVQRCLACGARSIPGFGFIAHCGKDGTDGAHRMVIPVEIPYAVAAQAVKAAYDSVTSYDRAQFDAKASDTLRELLRAAYKPLGASIARRAQT